MVIGVYPSRLRSIVPTRCLQTGYAHAAAVGHRVFRGARLWNEASGRDGNTHGKDFLDSAYGLDYAGA
jgi:hypothetical protein